MACYLGELITTGDTVTAWHTLECFWDSLEGKSPLMHLCRMCHDRSQAVHAPQLTFLRVGINPADTAFADVDYKSHPEWNHVDDFRAILVQIHARISLLLSPGSDFGGSTILDPTTCKRWYYYPASTIATLRQQYLDKFSTGFITPIQLLFFERIEDWVQIMDAMKVVLDALSGMQVKSQPWRSLSAGLLVNSYAFSPPLVPLPIGDRDAGGLKGYANSHYVTGNPPGSGGGSNVYAHVTLSEQKYEDVVWNKAARAGFPDYYQRDGRLVVGFYDYGFHDPRFGTISDQWRTPGIYSYMWDPDWVMANNFRFGWWRIKKNTARFYMSYNGTAPASKLLGKTFNWTVQVKRLNLSANSPDMAHDASVDYEFVGPSSGSFTINAGTLASIQANSFFVSVTIQLVEPAIPGSTTPLETNLQGGYDEGYGVLGSAVPVLTLTQPSFGFCLDGCGNYNDAT